MLFKKGKRTAKRQNLRFLHNQKKVAMATAITNNGTTTTTAIMIFFFEEDGDGDGVGFISPNLTSKTLKIEMLMKINY